MNGGLAVDHRKKDGEEPRYRCGYCLTSERIAGLPMAIEHLIPQVLGGPTLEEKLWLACSRYESLHFSIFTKPRADVRRPPEPIDPFQTDRSAVPEGRPDRVAVVSRSVEHEEVQGIGLKIAIFRLFRLQFRSRTGDNPGMRRLHSGEELPLAKPEIRLVGRPRPPQAVVDMVDERCQRMACRSPLRTY